MALIVCVCSLMFVGALVPAAAGEKEDEVELQIRGLESEDLTVRQSSAKELMRMGEAARPALEALSKALGDPDEVVSYRASKALVNLWPESVTVLTEALASDDTSVRKNAADALNLMALDGRDCTSAAPALVACLGDENARVVTRCSASLVAMGAPAVPPLIAGLGHGNAAVRCGAASSLGKIGHEAGAAAPHLARGLKDDDAVVRESCAGALGKIGPSAKEAIPSLVQALDVEDVELRCRVIEVLGSIAVDGGTPDAVDNLVKGLGDRSQRVRSRASDSLAKAGSTAVPALSDAFSSGSPTMRAAAAKTLGKMGTEAGSAAPGLSKGLADSDRNVREACAVALEKIGPAGREAVPALIGALGDADIEVRCRVVDALSVMPGEEPGIIEALITAFADESSRVGNRADKALVRWGPESAPYLAAALSNADYRISLGAAKALKQISGCPPSAVPQLIEGLGSGIDEVRDTSLVVLGRIGPEAREALPALREIAESDRSSSARRRAEEVIRLIDTE